MWTSKPLHGGALPELQSLLGTFKMEGGREKGRQALAIKERTTGLVEGVCFCSLCVRQWQHQISFPPFSIQSLPAQDTETGRKRREVYLKIEQEGEEGWGTNERSLGQVEHCNRRAEAMRVSICALCKKWPHGEIAMLSEINAVATLIYI